MLRAGILEGNVNKIWDDAYGYKAMDRYAFGWTDPKNVLGLVDPRGIANEQDMSYIGNAAAFTSCGGQGGAAMQQAMAYSQMQGLGQMGAANQQPNMAWPTYQGQICPYGNNAPIETYREYEKNLVVQRCGCAQCVNDRIALKEFKAKDKEIKVADIGKDNEILPDISLARVFKWAIVLVVAMGLGNRIWNMFGPRIENNLKAALGAIEGKGEVK